MALCTGMLSAFDYKFYRMQLGAFLFFNAWKWSLLVVVE